MSELPYLDLFHEIDPFKHNVKFIDETVADLAMCVFLKIMRMVRVLNWNMEMKDDESFFQKVSHMLKEVMTRNEVVI